MKDRPTGKKKVVLVAEDDAQDRCLLRYAVAAASSPLSFHFVDDGAEAISYLKGEGQYANRKQCPRPDIAVLDVNMPKVDGLQVLDWIEASGKFEELKVIVLTSSGGPDLQTWASGRNATFLVKPVSLNVLIEIVRGLERL